MEHILYVSVGSNAEERLLFLFEETNSEYSKMEVWETINGEGVNIYAFGSDTYQRIKNYLKDEEGQ